MILFLNLVVILQNFSIALGTGASTLAILNFFSAIADGKIDDTERRMMGIVYTVLRIAMVLILGTSLLLISTEYGQVGLAGLSDISAAQIFILLVLYFNAMLMTAHLIPSTFGPGIQAGSWYALGIVTSLQLIGVIEFTLMAFFMSYVTWLVLVIGVVNGVMGIMKHRRIAAAKAVKPESKKK